MVYKIKQKDWNTTPKDYKSTRNGEKYMLKMTDKGTALVPVEVVKDKTPKTKLTFVVQGNYGSGWEDVTEEENYLDLKKSLKDYDENEPQYPHRKIVRRVKI